MVLKISAENILMAQVIVFEPAYYAYYAQIAQAGGVVVPVVLDLIDQPRVYQPGDLNKTDTGAHFQLNATKLREAISPRTKLLVLNNPNNPSGKLFSAADLALVAELVSAHDLLVLADECHEVFF